MDESYSTMHSGGSGVKENSFAIISRPSSDNKGSSISFAKARCFELIGYPPNFNNKSVTGQSGTNNVSVNSKDVDTSVGTSHTLTSDQYERLMSLLSDTGSGSMAHANVAGFSSIVPGGDMPLLSRLTNGNIINCLVSNCLWQNKLGHPADQVLEVLQGRTHLDKVVD
ncbi:hypothetical protein Tco_0123395 [Tanacetum coccineum]